MTAAVTDNAFNFVKAFQVYQKTDADSDAEEEGSEEVLQKVLSTGEDDNSNNNFVLLPHRCVSHTCNLICTADIEKWLSNRETKAVKSFWFLLHLLVQCIVQGH